jgi:N6-L-threonylcarbamoyladenine synthase
MLEEGSGVRVQGSENAEAPSSLNPEPRTLNPSFPAVGLVCSGGHTALYHLKDWLNVELIGTTIDDAVGEAYDKVAALLGLGYPGGPIIDRLAAQGDPKAIAFPRSLLGHDSLDFSFSGLKTALLYAVRELAPAELAGRRANLAASYQHAIVRALVERTHQAAKETGAATIAVVGGVAANSELRAALPEAVLAPLELCTDNAAMIASAARFADPIPYPGYLALDAYASSA